MSKGDFEFAGLDDSRRYLETRMTAQVVLAVAGRVLLLVGLRSAKFSSSSYSERRLRRLR